MEKQPNKKREARRTEAGADDQDCVGTWCILTKKSAAMLSLGVSLGLLLIIVTAASVLANPKSDNMVFFPTGGHLMDYLIQIGDIQDRDGLQVIWYHAANNKSEMEKALKSSAMVLEADVNVEGYNTVNETSTPIMAHPPDVHSDNTFQEWLDRVVTSNKGIKLDFKSIEAVGPSLEILQNKNRTGINRPVWLNADILHGPNVPSFWPVVNGTRFLELIGEKFPDVTISPGWKVLYVPLLPNATYSRSMVEKMYEAVRHVPQRVTFPVLAVMVKRAWPHFSWLLSQSPRFSLTLWQGSENPSVNDLLFVRDNIHPQRVYYDIYEPVLSQFKEAARLSGRPRMFYSGGDLLDYLKPQNNDGVNIQWNLVSNRASLMSVLRDQPGGMLVIRVGSEREHPDVLVVENSDPQLVLQECLDLLFTSPKPWGLYLQIPSQSLLAPTLRLLNEAFNDNRLHHPTWINMNLSHASFQTPGYIVGQEFLDTVNEIFPYVTLAPGWPKEALVDGYTHPLVYDMVQLFSGTWQEVALQVQAVPLGLSYPGRRALLQAQPRFTLTVHHGPEQGVYNSGFLGLMSARGGNIRRTFYIMPHDYMNKLFIDIYTS